MSIELAAAILLLCSLALAALLVPLLLYRGGARSRETYNLAVYRDQLAELDRDLARGVLSQQQAAASRAEIGRRILALGRAAAPDAARPTARIVAVIAVLLLPVGAFLLYGELGAPGVPDEPFAARHDNPPAEARASHPKTPAPQSAAPPIDMPAALARVRAHLKAHPDDLTGWLVLARAELGLKQYAAASEAYRHAADLSGRRADILGDWGEAQVLAAGGTVTKAARDVFAAALIDPETAPRSRYYLALYKMQHGDVAGALKAWRALVADSPTDAVWLPLVKGRIAEAEAALAAAATKPGQTNSGSTPASGR